VAIQIKEKLMLNPQEQKAKASKTTSKKKKNIKQAKTKEKN
jgi:hypothetical protein